MLTTQIITTTTMPDIGGVKGKAAAGDFRAAQRTRVRGGVGATARGGSADSHRDKWTLDQLRKQTRSLQRNNKLSRSLVQRTIDFAVSDGPRIQVKSGDAGFDRAAEVFLRNWARSGVDHRSYVGIDGRMQGNGLTELCGLAISEAFEAGDVWFMPTDEGRVQVLEAERVLSPAGSANGFAKVDDGGRIVNGVELDAMDRPVAVHIGQWEATGGGTNLRQFKTTRLPIGQVLQLGMPLHRKVNLTRPEPGLAALIEGFDRIDGYIRDVGTSAHMAAHFGLMFKTEAPQNLHLELPGSTVEKVAADGVLYGQKEIELGPGFMVNLGTGETVEQIKPEQPTTQFGDFVLNNLSMIGAEAGLPLVLWLMDVRQANFASTRVAMLLAGCVVAVWRRWLCERMCLPILRWRLAMALNAGQVVGEDGRVYGPGQKGGVPDAWDDVRVGFPPLPVVDTLSQYQAEAYAIEKGLKTFEDVLTHFFGQDYAEHTDRLAFERQDRESKGILPQGTPGQIDPNIDRGVPTRDQPGGENKEGAIA